MNRRTTINRALIRDFSRNPVGALLKWSRLLSRLAVGSVRYQWAMWKVDRKLAKYRNVPLTRYFNGLPEGARGYAIRRAEARVRAGGDVWPPTSFETRYKPPKKKFKRKRKMNEAESYEGCEAKRESLKALLVLIPDIDHEPIWVPKSVIHDDSEVWKEGHTGTLAVHRWWAEKQGWV